LIAKELPVREGRAAHAGELPVSCKEAAARRLSLVKVSREKLHETRF
jgi:hypothetical protein